MAGYRRNFNPRSPHGERPGSGCSGGACRRISIHAPRTGSDTHAEQLELRGVISIHAPRTGSDGDVRRGLLPRGDFNPRSPHGERRPVGLPLPLPVRFQSTLPARGATAASCRRTFVYIFQSTLPARGATTARARARRRTSSFQSTLPARGATNKTAQQEVDALISIHAPRTGSDASQGYAAVLQQIFQSTLPARGATRREVPLHLLHRISIHAPRTGSDRKTYSCGCSYCISIHAPRTGSDSAK